MTAFTSARTSSVMGFFSSAMMTSRRPFLPASAPSINPVTMASATELDRAAALSLVNLSTARLPASVSLSGMAPLSLSLAAFWAIKASVNFCS